ncbi:MAG: Omp28-related outer membrane protein [Bacteroidales bacterium]
MRHTFRYMLLSLLSLTLFTTCDVEDEPYLEEIGKHNPPGPEEKVRKILLEEFTGHLCVNCPEGIKLANDLKIQYGEQLILMTIHAGTFAVPENEGLYTADYRTATGTDIHDFFNAQFYPSAMINRSECNGQVAMFTGLWQQAIDALIELPPDAFIAISNQFNEGTRELASEIEVEILNNLSGDYNMAFYIIENGIISAQKNDDASVGDVPDIVDFEHKHMLRGAYLGAWGTPLISGGALAGETHSTNFTLIMEEEWKEENCALITVFYDAQSREIIQAEEKGIVE